ncbi:SDR family NAD(P)-dependent oxidoreductase [Clostridium arbusti]|nr:SDR family NAD(P)-dependent oxidoreductase [Clostridium arbusti]
MIKSGGGSIVNVSSINGIKAMANSATYSATKFAVHILTKSAE